MGSIAAAPINYVIGFIGAQVWSQKSMWGNHLAAPHSYLNPDRN